MLTLLLGLSAGCRSGPGGAEGGEVVVLRGLTAGDRACYAEVEDANGERRSDEAAFELCERRELVGRRVRLRRERAQVPAKACQGDPGCTRSDTVELIVAAEPQPESAR